MLLRSWSARDVSPARAPRRKPVFVIDQSGDRLEREADRAADAAMKGGGVRFDLSVVPVQRVQRQGNGSASSGGVDAEKTEEEKYEEAGKKVAEAFADTPQGRAIIETIEADPLVQTVKDAGEKFVGTTPGKVVVGASAVGAVAALAATHKPLPIGIPEVPLETVSPKLAGWTMQITWEGPVDQPTKAMVGFSFSGKTGAR